MRDGPPYTIGIIAGQLVVGGAERQLYLWLSGLDRGLFTPVVVTLNPDADDYWEPQIESLGIPLLRVPRRHNRAARTLEIARALRPFRPHLLHAWHLFAGPYAGIAAKILGARACLGSLRGSFEALGRHRLSAGLTLSLADGLLVNSQAAGDRIRVKFARNRKPVFVVPNAVENHLQDRSVARTQLSERFGLNQSDVWLGSMGRIQGSKRFDLLLDLAASLMHRGEHVHLLLIGDGPALKELRVKSALLGVDKSVTFVGSDPSARTWLKALDIFCFPSLDEGLPNVVMEAAVAGVPIVAWKLPFIEELLVDGVSALMAAPGSLEGLEEAVLMLLHDEQARQSLGGEARKRILSEYSVGRFVARMTGTYSELLQSASAEDRS